MLFKDLVNKGVKVWLDLSTYCNASCPQCHRTDKNGLGKVDWLPLIKWTLDDFTKKFPPGSIDYVKEFEICGTWGDPIMSKDIGKIIKYIVDNSQAHISLNTNGGMRTPEWWEDLGSYCKERLLVHFDVDGTTNEMHQKYRRGVDLQTVLDNMEAYSAGGGDARAFIILFKHNQDHIDDIKKMCIMYGARETYVIKSDRFTVNSKYEFINENGEQEYLEEITKDFNDQIGNPWVDTASKNLLRYIGKKDKSQYSATVGSNDR